MLSQRIVLLGRVTTKLKLYRCCNTAPERKDVTTPEASEESDKMQMPPLEHDRPLMAKENVKTSVISTLSGSIVKRFEKVLQRTVSASVFQKYKWATGSMDALKEDAKIYMDVSGRMSDGEEFGSFTRKELLVFQQMPGEIIKAVPILVLCFIPFGFWVLPALFMFPKVFLTSHFLTDQQLRDVQIRKLSWRLNKFPNVMDFVKIQVRVITDQQEAYNALRSIIIKSEEGVQIFSEEIIQASRGFLVDHSNISFWKMRWLYQRRMAGAQGMSKNRLKMYNQAMVLHNIDLCMAREGLDSLSDRDMQMACFTRGLNADGLTREEQQAFLNEWLAVSLSTTSRNISMLLHSSVFLNYDAPTNVELKWKWFWKKRLRISEH